MSVRDQLPVAISDCHQLLGWLIPQLDQFPRVRRFTLGEKLEKVLLEVLEHLLDAAYQRTAQKGFVLQQANRKLALARHLWRLGFELKSCHLRRIIMGLNGCVVRASDWRAGKKAWEEGREPMPERGNLWEQVLAPANLWLACVVPPGGNADAGCGSFFC